MHALIKGTIYVSPDVEPILDGAVLIEGVERGDIRSFFILCPQCAATSFVDADAV